MHTPTFACVDVIMSAMASQITSLTIVYSTVFSSGADKQKHQTSASLAFVRGIHRWPVNSPHKGPETRKCLYLMTSCHSWVEHVVSCTSITIASRSTRLPPYQADHQAVEKNSSPNGLLCNGGEDLSTSFREQKKGSAYDISVAL